MSTLVTGGGGFIGSYLVEALLQKGESVRVLDNFSTGRRGNLEEIIQRLALKNPQDYTWSKAPGPEGPECRLTILEGDIRDRDACRQAMSGVRFVLHQAALPSVPRSIEDPLTTHEVNASGTLNLLTCAREAGVERFVYASSSSVYGDISILPKVETMIPRPLSPYAVSKLMGEYYCQVFHRVWGLSTVSLRYFNIYGPRQDPSSQYAAVIPRFITALIEGKAPTIFGDGFQSRDFTFIQDCVQANLLACKPLQEPDPSAESSDPSGDTPRVMNIACGQRTDINKMYQELLQILKMDIRSVHTDPRSGDVRHSQADITQARNQLNYHPQFPIQKGLRETVPYYQAC